MTVTARRLTGALPAAIAVVRLEGAGSAELLRRLGAAEVPALGRVRRLLLFRSNGESLDETLVAATAEHAFEVGMHGGPAVVQRFLDAAEGAGARILPSAEAGTNDRALEAAARSAAAAVSSASAALGLLAQAEGSLRRELERLLAAFESGQEALAWSGVEDLWRASVAAAPYFRPVQVALVGPPSAGKSSLFNAIVGRADNRVDERAGSTSDPIVRRVLVGELSVDLWDTAGLDPRAQGVQGRAIAAAAERARAADLRVWVSARGADLPAPRLWREGDLEVATRADLGPPVRPVPCSVSSTADPDGARDAVAERLLARWPLPAELAGPSPRLFREAEVSALGSARNLRSPAALIRVLRTLVNGSALLEDLASAPSSPSPRSPRSG